jgi:hypothetical protein
MVNVRKLSPQSSFCVLSLAKPYFLRGRHTMRKVFRNRGKLFVGKRGGVVSSCAPWLASGALGLLTMAASNPVEATTIIQNFTTTDTFTSFSPAIASTTTYFSPFPQFTVQPFDTALGTLTSTRIVWATTASFTGTIGEAAGGGSASFGLGGTYFIESAAYNGNGSSSGNGGLSGDIFSTTIPSFGVNNLFLTSEAGVTYNPALLTLFIGGSPFSIAYINSSNQDISPYPFSFTNIESGSASFTTMASVTYDFVPVPGPLPLLGAGAAWGWSRKLRRRCTPGSR